MFKNGGYLIIRKSKVGWWPHFLWSQDLKEFRHYVPLEYKENKPVPPLIFDGYVNVQFVKSDTKI